MTAFRAGGACPLDDCNFQFLVVTDDEGELDIVGAAIMQAHSDRNHEGMPVSLFGFAADPEAPLLKDDEERPRLIN